MSKDGTYNGWANWATWNVALWIDNDEPMYREKERFKRRTATITAANVESFVKDMMPTGTPDYDSPKEYNAVDWDEIARNWTDEVAEDA